MTDFTGNVYDTGGTVFNVKAFGATGDGTTSDTTAVQDALDAAKTANGGVVFFPAGTYPVRHLLLSNADGVTLLGAHGAVIRYEGGLTPPLWDKFIQFDRCTRIRVEGLAWDNRQVNRFGGLEFYDCSRVWINRNHFYDSAPTSNPDDKDRRSVFFYADTPDASNNRDIWITDNIVEDLQLEVHVSRNVHVRGNTVRHSPVTGGILLVALNADGCTVEDVWICENLVEDPDGAAIYVVLDGTQYDDTTFRGIHISGNRIKLGMPGKSVRAIFLGSGNNSVATSGNVLHDVHIENNQVWVTADSTDLSSAELIFVNDSATAGWDVQRLTVRGNRVLGNGTGTGIDLRRINNSVITDNFVANVANGLSCVVRGGNMIAGNSSDATTIGFALNFNSTTGNNTTRDNKVLGTPTTRFNVSGTGTGGDYIELERLAFAASFPGATINDGARYDQDITVAYAALGDQVAVGCTTVNTSGIQVTGNVVAVSGSNGTVRVTIFNHSGAARTFGAGTIRGSVTRLA